jgi:hypothetical protein
VRCRDPTELGSNLAALLCQRGTGIQQCCQTPLLNLAQIWQLYSANEVHTYSAAIPHNFYAAPMQGSDRAWLKSGGSTMPTRCRYRNTVLPNPTIKLSSNPAALLCQPHTGIKFCQTAFFILYSAPGLPYCILIEQAKK